MTEDQKTQLLQQIRKKVANLDRATQRQVIWDSLILSISGDPEAINWLFEAMGEFLEGEMKQLLSPYQ